MATGCILSTESERGDEKGKVMSHTHGSGSNAQGRLNSCKHSQLDGCIQGVIPAAPQIRVEGQNFQDAEDFKARFATLVKIVSTKEDLNAPAETSDLVDDGWDISLTTPLDNKSFARDFMVFAKASQTARAASSISTGMFFINNLEEGIYDIRVQKELHFVAKKDDVVKTFCASLKSDQTIEVAAGQKTKIMVDDFKLFLRQSDSCDVEDDRLVIVVPS